MKICPVAIAVGCRACPVFKVCPAKSLIGDYRPEEPAVARPVAGKRARPAARTAAKRVSKKAAPAAPTAAKKTARRR